MTLNAKLRKVVNQNAWMGTKNGSERQWWRKNGDVTGCGYETTTLNIELRMNNGSERQSANVALNAKWEMNDGSERQTKQWLWTPKRSMNDSSKSQKKMNGSERQNGKRTMALNAKWKVNDGSER